jgi:hypothetical protein
VAQARRLYPAPADGDGDAWWARPPEAARLRSCRGRVAQAQIDAGFDARIAGPVDAQPDEGRS